VTAADSARSQARFRGVTLVTPGFPPDTGGVEAHTAALARQLQAHGIDVEVLTARRGQRAVTVKRSAGMRVVTYPAWPVRTLSISPRLVLAAIRRRRSGRLLHVHSYHASTALAILGPQTGTVFTPHYHGTHGHSPLGNLLHLGFRHLARVGLRRCDAVICVSDSERARLVEDFPFVADKAHVIPNGVNADAIRAAMPFDGQPPTVCCAGRLERYKRVADIVTAFAEVPPPAHLVIIGDGTARQELLGLIDELGLQARVTVTGAVSDAVLHRWLRTTRVFISMSQREAFGIAALEAAAAGARVILSDIAAHREIATQYLGDCAVLVPESSPEVVATEIRRNLALGCAPVALIPDWSEVAVRTVEIYAAVAGTAQLHRSPETNQQQIRKNTDEHVA
jgi:glycosyltransferase involved in cell wall biosynthesis